MQIISKNFLVLAANVAIGQNLSIKQIKILYFNLFGLMGKIMCCSRYLWVALSSMYGQALVLVMLAVCLVEVMDNSVRIFSMQV